MQISLYKIIPKVGAMPAKLKILEMCENKSWKKTLN